MFPGIGALPEPATESHVVNRGTPVGPCRLKGPEKKSHPRGKPPQSRFPKYHELFEEPHHCKAASSSLTAKGREHTEQVNYTRVNHIQGPRGTGIVSTTDVMK